MESGDKDTNNNPILYNIKTKTSFFKFYSKSSSSIQL